MGNENLIYAGQDTNQLSRQIVKLAVRLNFGVGIAEDLFAGHNETLFSRINKEVERLKKSSQFKEKVNQASKDLEEWAKSGKQQNYNPESLALARVSREIANIYEQDNSSALMLFNSLHQTAITYAFSNGGLLQKIIEEGNAGRKIGIVEMADRIGPALQPAGSSSYYHVKYVPYGTQARSLIGEKVPEDKKASFVKPQVAIESAFNLVNNFGVYYALTETSAAPKPEVPKSGRKPEAHICTQVMWNRPIVESYEIDTLLRTEFDSILREKMYHKLNELYKK